MRRTKGKRRVLFTTHLSRISIVMQSTILVLEALAKLSPRCMQDSCQKYLAIKTHLFPRPPDIHMPCFFPSVCNLHARGISRVYASGSYHQRLGNIAHEGFINCGCSIKSTDRQDTSMRRFLGAGEPKASSFCRSAQ